ncbi:hypothetical protein [Anaerospora hongkongensis]|uniref:hypothetical protein n=1 Tax=Anaerospora hongkongensis TaxID=244830 RepID=UPI00289BD8B4|nr:hypothetical protein [Anaerospora hongkongensis]
MNKPKNEFEIAKSTLITRAVALGIEQTTMQIYVRRHGLITVAEQVNNLAYAIEAGKINGKPVKNPAGWLHVALSANYDNKA